MKLNKTLLKEANLDKIKNHVKVELRKNSSSHYVQYVKLRHLQQLAEQFQHLYVEEL